ncbi:adaptor protein MecA [Pullulanibacillus sp. KACC 23026]|uniref:adaptor protein MecA n=1 Tax=Pullulanibacillus sp. KACC 23026 TaxID=3028315 RepID=UPI0023B14385|nr:adaptor protein MecA [Pullulanibacillus sp. KACC 23026]WEG11918.1 adaptor protein MecA [Pullulanibacillus sp. KACC 23026]
MEIERVNEYTLKCFISYLDIENRGFTREDIWSDRERGEELFWEMMDEANHQESFPLEGPLWIQVQALEKGLEIIVTRAQLSKDGSKLELPISQDKHLDIPVNESFEDLLSERHEKRNKTEEDSEDEWTEDDLTFLIQLEDFESMIALSARVSTDNILTHLYHYDGDYYLEVVFSDILTEDEQEDRLSLILEYGFETGLSNHVLHEYGKLIMQDHAIETTRHYFSN